MFGSLKFWLYLIPTLLFLGLVAWAYNHYTGLVADNKQLTADLAITKALHQDALDAAVAWQQSAETYQTNLAAYETAQGGFEQQKRSIEDELASKDLRAEAKVDWNAAMAYVNDHAAASRRMLECTTGYAPSCAPPGLHTKPSPAAPH